MPTRDDINNTVVRHFSAYTLAGEEIGKLSERGTLDNDKGRVARKRHVTHVRELSDMAAYPADCIELAVNGSTTPGGKSFTISLHAEQFAKRQVQMACHGSAISTRVARDMDRLGIVDLKAQDTWTRDCRRWCG